jgi:hypothetical protein
MGGSKNISVKTLKAQEGKIRELANAYAAELSKQNNFLTQTK